MKRVFQIGNNDIRLFLRMKVGYVWFFGVPLVFVYFFGIAFRGPGSPSNPRPAVLIENRDTGFLGTLLMEELDAQGMHLVDQTERDQAERGIRIPANFTDKVLKTEPVKVEFFQIEGSGAESAFLIELRLIRAIVALNSHLFELASRTNNAPNEVELRALAKAENPVSLKAQFAGRDPTPAGFNQSLPGTLVQFLMMNLMIFGGASLAGERADGVLRRLAVYPIRRWELVLGKVYGRFLLGGVQIIFFLLVGQFIFKVNLGPNLFAILLTLSLYAWVAASLGVWIGAVVKNEDKIIGLCVLASSIMAALGGCWWPLEIVPATLQVVAHFVPTGWAMEALHQLISFGGGWETVLAKLGVLALFAAVANFGAAKMFRY
jgi:ABC-type multidrug transport system permease subunit